jgi:hypothetical protein
MLRRRQEKSSILGSVSRTPSRNQKPPASLVRQIQLPMVRAGQLMRVQRI